MTQSVRVSSSNKDTAGEWVGISGAWKAVPKMWNGISGAWKVYFIAFSGVTHTYDSGSGDETVPPGSVQLVVTDRGPGGSGAPGLFPEDEGGPTNGGGAGSGGRSVKTIAIDPSDWGSTLAYVVGASASGDSSTVSGTLAAGSVSMTAASGTDGGDNGSTGTGGGASGGDSNTTGNNASGMTGGAGLDGLGGGGNGGSGGSGNSDGGHGRVSFAWT